MIVAFETMSAARHPLAQRILVDADLPTDADDRQDAVADELVGAWDAYLKYACDLGDSEQPHAGLLRVGWYSGESAHAGDGKNGGC
jgi:hypothetical protein